MTTASHFLELLTDDNPKHFVEGEAEAVDFIGRIDITDWNWDVKDPTAHRSEKAATNTGTVAKSAIKASTGGDTDTRIQPSLFSFDKYVDRSTTRLMTCLDTGFKFRKARFTLREELPGVEKGPHSKFSLVVTLEGDVVLTKGSVSLKATDFGVDLEESWTLRYSTITFELGGETGEYRMVDFKLPPGSETEASKRPTPTFMQQLENLDTKQRAAVHMATMPKKG